jgi:hypothetical protein
MEGGAKVLRLETWLNRHFLIKALFSPGSMEISSLTTGQALSKAHFFVFLFPINEISVSDAALIVQSSSELSEVYQR